MPQQRNSTREPLTRERKQGLLISALIHIVLAILIIFVTFRIKMPELSEEGLLVNFGYDETGQGLYEPAPQPAAPPPPAPSEADQGAEEAILTQDFEEAPVVEKKEPDPEELRKQAEARAAAEKRRQEEALAAAKQRRDQEIADSIKRVEDAQRQITQTSNARAASAFGNASNTGTTGQNQGVAGGQGNQGVPEGTVGADRYGPGGGTGDSNISYNLGGRGYQSLPKPPYDYQGEGRVVVEVTVDQSGRVTNARAGITGSTTTDDYLLRVAREAALKARFDSSPNTPIQKGTITYIFKLN